MLVKNKNSNTVLMVVVGFAVILLISIVIAVIVISTRQAKIPQSIDGGNVIVNTPSGNSADDSNGGGSNSDDEGLATNDLTGKISYKALVASVLQLRVSIDRHIDSGNCFLTMTGPNKQEYTEQADILASSDKTSTCSGFDIPISTLNQLDKDSKNLNGKWTIKIHLQTKGHTGDINSEVTL